jgi:MOSC domain-containing protein YiiM
MNRKAPMPQAGVLIQINVSQGGMPKLPVPEAFVGRNGVAGDKQRALKYHGGPDRAVCLYSQELYQWLAGQGVRLDAGSVGENLTTAGIDLQSLEPGDHLRVGPCTIQITDVRIPCGQLAKWHPKLKNIITGHSGWVARVIEEGTVHPGDRIEMLPREEQRGASVAD